jgi:Uma2 family endonuclease
MSPQIIQNTRPAARKRAPWGAVLPEGSPEEMVTEVDWSRWYLDEDDVAQSIEQGFTIRTLFFALEELARLRGWQNVVFGADNYFAWVPHEPLVRITPDIYLVDNPPPPPRPDSWQTWLPGHHPPRWALEIVIDDDWKKYYQETPPKYAQLGCSELVIFDPDAARFATNNQARVPLTVYRRGDDGLFVRVCSGQGPIYSVELDIWLSSHQEGAAVRLRPCFDQAGQQLVPTAAERASAEAERARVEEEKAHREAEKARIAQAQALAEAQAREQAEKRIRELEERLLQLEERSRN